MYAALQADDLAAFKAVATPDFRAFDGGVQYTAESLVAAIKAAHAAGKKFEWTVPGPEVHVACNDAWIVYVNRGSIADASATAPVTWLESAMLVYAGGQWRLRFFHSTRAKTP